MSRNQPEHIGHSQQARTDQAVYWKSKTNRERLGICY